MSTERNERVVSGINNSFLRGIASMTRPIGDRKTFEDGVVKLNEVVEKTLQALDNRESTKGLQIRDLLNVDLLSRVLDDDDDNLIAQVLGYVTHNTDQLHGYKELGLDLEGLSFGDLNLLAFDMINVHTEVVKELLRRIKNIPTDGTDTQLIEMLKAAIVYLNTDKLSVEHFYKEKGITPPEDSADFIFSDEYQEWTNEISTRVLVSLLNTPEIGVFLLPKGLEKAKEELLKIVPSELEETIQGVELETLLSDDFTAMLIRSIAGTNSLKDVDIRNLDASVKDSLVKLQAVLRELYSQNQFTEIEIGTNPDGTPQKAPLPSTTNLSELIYGMILAQSAKLHDAKLSNDDLSMDDDFVYIKSLYEDKLFAVINDEERYDAKVATRYLSTLALRTQLVVFLNILTRFKDQEVNMTLSYIQELIHDVYEERTAEPDYLQDRYVENPTPEEEVESNEVVE